jgi:hypothetical protein
MPPRVAAEKQLAEFIAKFAPDVARLIRQARAKMRRLLPHASELVYDNYNFFVIGYGPTAKPSEGIFSLAAQAKGVSLCFLQGARLPDPDHLLKGSGSVVRSLRLDSAATLDRADVQQLMRSALQSAKVPIPDTAKHELIIKSVSAKQRPRQTTPVERATAKKSTRHVMSHVKAPAPKARPAARQLTRLRRICLSLPGAVEKLSHGEPTFFIKNGVFAMFSNNHHHDGHVAVLLPAAPGVQEALIEEAPHAYYRPPYVGGAGWIGVELDQASDEALEAHVRHAWQIIEGKRKKKGARRLAKS